MLNPNKSLSVSYTHLPKLSPMILSISSDFAERKITGKSYLSLSLETIVKPSILGIIISVSYTHLVHIDFHYFQQIKHFDKKEKYLFVLDVYKRQGITNN